MMGRWEVTDPESGMTVTVDSETEPDDATLDAEFERQRRSFMQGSKAAMGVNRDAVKGNLAAAASGAALAVPFMAPLRAAGAAYGGYEGAKAGGKEYGPVGSVIGGLGGATAGALKPGTTGVVGGALGGLSEGSPLEALAGAALGAIGARGSLKSAKTIAQEVRTARAAASGVSGDMLETIMKADPSLTRTAAEGIARAIAAKGGRSADDVATAVKEAQTVAKVESALKGSRVERGAERVGRPLGKTKEQIRMETGPVLDEAVGDASPILPEKILFQMIDKMKSLPKTGGEREAYVARALDGKTKAQVENIRRTLQHLGLLLPVGVAGAMSQE